jgi:hypothetical protein
MTTEKHEHRAVEANPQIGADSTRPPSMMKWALGLAAWSVFVGLIVYSVTMKVVSARMQDALAYRPRVVVVDAFDWIKNAGEGQTLADKYRDGAQRLQQAEKKFGDQGILIIDRNAVVGPPPDELLIQVPSSQKQRGG